MKTIHNSRTARAARAIAARLDSVPEIHLYARTARAQSKLFRIHHYMNHFCGNYCFTSHQDNPLIIVTKNRA